MTIKNYLILFGVLCLVQLNFLSIVAEVASQQVDVQACIKNIRNNIYKETFDNGLTLLFYKKEHTPEVILKVMYNVGSKDEESTEYGFAHLVEHMIFKGTNKLSEQDILEISRKFGAQANACTDYDKTVYYFNTDNKNWRVFLAILADCMENVRIADEHLASEIKTVFDELKLRNDDGTGNLFTELLPSNHPYHHPVIGYKENLLNLESEKVRAFYKKYYRPDRATVIVVGDLDKDDVVNGVKELFGSISNTEKLGPEKSGLDFINKDFFQKDLVVYKATPYTEVSCVWTIPGLLDAKSSWCADIISKYLSDQLRKILYDERLLVAQVDAFSCLLFKAGVFDISFEPQEQKAFLSKKSLEVVTQLCKNSILREIEQIIATGIPNDEFIRVKQIEKVGLLSSFEHCSAIADTLEEYELFDRFVVLDTITNIDIKLFAHRYIRPNLMNVMTVKPLKEQEKDEWLAAQRTVDAYDSSLLALQARTIDLEKPVAVDQLPDPNLLDVTFEKPDSEFNLGNGLHVMIKQRKDVPFIIGQLFLKNAHQVDRYFSEHGKSEIPAMAWNLLHEGSVGYNKEEYRKFFESLGAYCDGNSISCLSTNFDAVAQRHTYILAQPTYPKKAFNKNISDTLECLEKLPEDEYYVAGDSLRKHLQQDDFLSKKTLKEVIAQLRKYKRADLVEFHEKYMAPSNMNLVVVGDFNEKTIRQQLENSYGQLKSSFRVYNTEKIEASFPELQNPKAKEQKIYLPKERVVLESGRIMVKKNDEDYFKLCFLEKYVNKKLFEMREQYGLVYACGCSLANGTNYQAGQAVIWAQLSLANVDVCIKLIKSILSDIAQNGISQEDFYNVRNTIISNWAKSNITNSQIASWFGQVKVHGFDWDHEEKRFAQCMNITCEQVCVAAKKYLNPDDWSFVTVGRVIC